jgi:hypothetical protein
MQSEEDAHAESVALWGKRGDEENMVAVCEVCWKKLMAWYKRTRVH